MSSSSHNNDTTVAAVEPNATLYIKNIDWKVKKQLLRRALYSLFTRHGKVLDIITLRKDGLRGQAFVIMETSNAAMAALNAEQGFSFFGKDMVIEYAHTKSDVIAKRDGDYVPKGQRPSVAKKRKIVTITKTDATNDTEATTTTLSVDGTTADGITDAATPTIAMDQDNKNTTDEVSSSSLSPPPPETSTVPTRILIAPSLPTECNEMMLHILFQQYQGYQPPVRITTTTTIATTSTGIILFDTEPNATIAYTALHQFQLSPLEKLQLTYGKE